MGRWISRDPIEEEGGENLLLFAGNAPVGVLDALGLTWKVFREGNRRARVVGDRGDTIADLAIRVRMEPTQSDLWLQPAKPTSYAVVHCTEEFTVPNTVYVNKTVIFPLEWISYATSEVNTLSGQGYFVLYNSSPQSTDASAAFVDPDIYGMIHVAHGDKTHKGNLQFVDLYQLGPTVTVHHKLGGLKVVQCWGGQKPWANIVSSTGVLYAKPRRLWITDAFSIARGF